MPDDLSEHSRFTSSLRCRVLKLNFNHNASLRTQAHNQKSQGHSNPQTSLRLFPRLSSLETIALRQK
jgi:hypothetical protein